MLVESSWAVPVAVMFPMATPGQPWPLWDHTGGTQESEHRVRSDFSALRVRKRASDGKLHIACISYTNPCLQREVFAGPPSCRVPLGHLGYLQVSPGWPWLLPGVMIVTYRVGSRGGDWSSVYLSEKQRNLRLKAHQRAQEWKMVKAAFPV